MPVKGQGGATESGLFQAIKLEKRIEAFLVKNRPRFSYLHFGMFIIFLLFYLIPPFLPLPADDATPWSSYFLFVKFAVWGLWFPLVLLTVIVFGRAWCGMLCPQGALSEFFNKRGQSKAVPGWIKWEGTPIVSFILITILGQLVGVREYPKPMLLIFGGTTVIAGFVGYRYTRGGRAWCRHLCPVGILLGIFSRLGMVGIERGNRGLSLFTDEAQRSRRIGTVPCVKVICPTYINLSTKASARHCIECMRCVDPGEKGALRLKLRNPGKEIEDVRRYNPDIYEVMFLFLATGLALGGFHWIANDNFMLFKDWLGGKMLDIGLGGFIGMSGPWWTMVNYPESGEVFNWLDFISIASYMTLFMVITGGALFMLTLASSLMVREEGEEGGLSLFTDEAKRSRRIGTVPSLMDKAAILGYAYAPVALLSLVLGLGAELFSLLDVAGFGEETVKGVRLAILGAGVIWSLYLNFKLVNRHYPAMIPNIFGVALVTWMWHQVI